MNTFLEIIDGHFKNGRIMSKLFTGIINEQEFFGASMSNGKAKSFISDLKKLELSLNIPSGVSNQNSDEYYIDIEKFTSFFEKMWKTINIDSSLYIWAQYAAGIIENTTNKKMTKFDSNNEPLIPIKYKNT